MHFILSVYFVLLLPRWSITLSQQAKSWQGGQPLPCGNIHIILNWWLKRTRTLLGMQVVPR